MATLHVRHFLFHFADPLVVAIATILPGVQHMAHCEEINSVCRPYIDEYQPACRVQLLAVCRAGADLVIWGPKANSVLLSPFFYLVIRGGPIWIFWARAPIFFSQDQSIPIPISVPLYLF